MAERQGQKLILSGPTFEWRPNVPFDDGEDDDEQDDGNDDDPDEPGAEYVEADHPAWNEVADDDLLEAGLDEPGEDEAAGSEQGDELEEQSNQDLGPTEVSEESDVPSEDDQGAEEDAPEPATEEAPTGLYHLGSNQDGISTTSRVESGS